MAEIDPEVIIKALRLVPEFDGNPHILTRFIKLCDQIVTAYNQPENNLANLYLINGILNKITGPAATTINSNGIPTDWPGIKSVLINNFSDQRDETTLYNDLAMQVQGSSSPQEFYDRCQTLFSTIMTYVTLHESVPTTISAKRDLYKKLTMQAYVRGLKEPLGSRIRCMRPESMEKALEFVQEEMNTLYLQQRNEGISKNAQPYNPKPVHVPMLMPKPQVPKPFTFGPVMKYPMPQGPPRYPVNNTQYPKPNLQFNPNQPRMPSRTQQMFAAPPQNYNPNSNVFRLPPRHFNTNPGPRPMSGVSHFTPKVLPPSGHDWTKYGNPPPTNYFKSRDVNLNECYTYEHDYNDYNCYPVYYEPEHVFYDSNSYSYTNEPTDYDPTNYMLDEQYTAQTPEVTYNEQTDDEPQPSTSQAQNFQKPSRIKKLK